ncbi:MAG: sulfotransferase family 2 domain-containing protein [Bacteroidetes bacterium]|nr:sulfotransferase family 2 domain-containing protein [Bacteroidota bacterium]
MIVSDTNKYVFLETPRTGSTAIAQELCELYGGKRMVRKHANYYDFLKHATEAQKEYFVFAGVRNPLDSVVSKFTKLKNNHKGTYTDPAFLKKNGGWVTPGDVKRFTFTQNYGFSDYIKKFHKTPFMNTLSVHHSVCDFIIKFESLNDDFENALTKLDMKPHRPLPLVNPTAKSPKTYIEFFSNSVQGESVNIFGPYMKEFGYDLPSEWGTNEPSNFSCILYRVKVLLAKVYCTINGRAGSVNDRYVASK